jgi:hypothetical protein
MSEFVYVIFGKPTGGKRVSLRKRSEVVNLAALECLSEGTTLEGFAGIPYAEDAEGNFWPARKLEGSELFCVAVDKLNEGGRFFAVFPVDDKGARDFVGMAAVFGLEQNARLLLDQN